MGEISLAKKEKMNRKHMAIFENISTGQGDGYATGCLLDYLCFKKYHESIGTDLRKQQKTRCWSKSNTKK